ncbi:MAG: adenosine-specific kinase [Candidatus Aenigmatarchaeota archaeon]
MKFEIIKVNIPANSNIIVAQSHFIKTVEDVVECLVNCVPTIKFGIAFNEGSGKCLVRYEGNDEELLKTAIDTASKVAAPHTLYIYIRNAYPINILPRLKEVPEIVNVFCATANPLKIVVVEDEEGNRGIIGVIDGFRVKGIENEQDKLERKEFLRNIGYKL